MRVIIPSLFPSSGISTKPRAIHIADSPVGELGAHVGPKGRAFGVLDPDAKHVLDTIHIHANSEMSRFGPNVPVITDLDPDRVEIDHGVELLEGPVLPVHHRLEHRISNI